MQALAPPIPFSADDLERRRLENTIDHDLSSLSFTASTSFTSHGSGSSLSTIPVARSAHAHAGRPLSPDYPRYPSTGIALDSDETPRASKRAAASFMRSTDFASEGVGLSPASTAGHHVSAATLGAGVFQRPGGRSFRDRTGDEFDPDRSLGRLVSELNKAKDEEQVPPKPASPFAHAIPKSPHSPSPTSSAALPNLSFQLTRTEPPLSPPHSRTVSSSSSASQNQQQAFGAPATHKSTGTGSRHNNSVKHTALNETARHNRPPQPAIVPGSVSNRDKGRFKAPILVPVVLNSKTSGHLDPAHSADITGLTGLLTTPAKGDQFEDLGKNGADVGTAGSNIPQALATLQARIRALETENGVSRRRIRELEAEVDSAREEVVSASRECNSRDSRLREVLAEKAALEELVGSLRENLKRLTLELEENKALVSRLRMAAEQPPSPAKYDISVHDELAELRREVERLSQEVAKLNRIAESGLTERTRAREQRSVRINALDLHDQDEVNRVRADVDRRVAGFTTDSTRLPSQLRQGLHAAAAPEPTLMPPSAGPPTRLAESNHSVDQGSPSPPMRVRTLHSVTIASPAPSIQSVQSQRSTSTTSSGRRRRKERKEGPDSPFPSIRVEDEHEFFSPRHAAAASLPAHRSQSRASISSRANATSRANVSSTRSAPHADTTPVAANETVRSILIDGNVPPQTVLARVVRELEDDFGHYKKLYCELADQYRVLDAASVAAKRHVLAEHLKEVIDTLEQKADQIGALYSLLRYEDRPCPSSSFGRPAPVGPRRKSVRDLWRAVRESLPEDARTRLEADGLFRS